MKAFAANMGPTVWELEGPIPIENKSNTLMFIVYNSNVLVILLYTQDTSKG
jgi:hypothetical protein